MLAATDTKLLDETFALWRVEPDTFAEDVLGVTIWPHQRRILRALTQHRRVAVRSCNSVGKDFVAAVATLWFPIAYPGDCRVVTTAPTGHQLQDVVWGREIHRLYHGARVPLGGRLLDLEWDISPTEQAVAISTASKEALQGLHAEHLLVIVDEASAEELGDDIWQGLDSLAASGDARMLILGNPTRTEGRFYRAFHEEAEEWEPIHIAASETPNLQACAALGSHDVPSGCNIVQPGLVTHEWCEDARRIYGEDSDYYRVHVLGDFPLAGSDALIPLDWIEQACERPRYNTGHDAPRMAGLDVARHGSDQTAIAVLHDADLLAVEGWSEGNLMATVGRVLRYLKEWDIRCIAIDDTNMHGVSDRLIEIAEEQGELDLAVLPVNWASHADDQKTYHNKPSEMWAALRENLDPNGDQPMSLRLGDREAQRQLAAQLGQARYKFDSYGMGRLWVDKMGESTKSPDMADALALAVEAWHYYYTSRGRERLYGGTAGVLGLRKVI